MAFTGYTMSLPASDFRWHLNAYLNKIMNMKQNDMSITLPWQYMKERNGLLLETESRRVVLQIPGMYQTKDILWNTEQDKRNISMYFLA